MLQKALFPNSAKRHCFQRTEKSRTVSLGRGCSTPLPVTVQKKIVIARLCLLLVGGGLVRSQDSAVSVYSICCLLVSVHGTAMAFCCSSSRMPAEEENRWKVSRGRAAAAPRVVAPRCGHAEAPRSLARLAAVLCGACWDVTPDGARARWLRRPAVWRPRLRRSQTSSRSPGTWWCRGRPASSARRD